MTEAEILQGLKNGDERSFRTIVDQYQSKVKAACMGILHNPADADDVAQEVFIEVFRSVGQFRENAHLSSWIYRIAVNKSLNLLRSRKRSRYFTSITDLFSPKEAHEAASSSAGNPDIESKQRTDILHKAINDLPEKQRIAFVLNKYDDLSYKEIAEVMETTLPGVESLIYRAKINLQKKLERCWKKNCL